MGKRDKHKMQAASAILKWYSTQTNLESNIIGRLEEVFPDTVRERLEFPNIGYVRGLVVDIYKDSMFPIGLEPGNKGFFIPTSELSKDKAAELASFYDISLQKTWSLFSKKPKPVTTKEKKKDTYQK